MIKCWYWVPATASALKLILCSYFVVVTCLFFLALLRFDESNHCQLIFSFVITLCCYTAIKCKWRVRCQHICLTLPRNVRLCPKFSVNSVVNDCRCIILYLFVVYCIWFSRFFFVTFCHVKICSTLLFG